MIKWLQIPPLLLILLLSLNSTLILADASVMEIIQLQNRTSEDISVVIAPLLEPQDRVIANGNTLIVKTTPARLKTLQQLINKLDTPIQNLIITVIQDQHMTAEALNARANIQVQGQHTSNSAIIRGRINGHFNQSRGQSNINNNQTVRTIEGRPAHIEVGKVQPIRRKSTYHSPYGYHETTTTTDFIKATTGFAVTPRLAGSHQVILDVAPWSDRFNKYGAIETQGAQTTVRVNLGEWVEIGSISEDSYTQRNGFLSHSSRNQSNNLHILIKVDKAP